MSMNITEITKQMKELEIKAEKYENLKGFINDKLPKIHEKLKEIHVILNEVNPVLSISKGTIGTTFKKGQRMERVNEIYKDMIENETEYTREDIERKYDINKGSAYSIFLILGKMKGISTRFDSKIKILFYYKSSRNQEELKKIMPKEFSYMA